AAIGAARSADFLQVINPDNAMVDRVTTRLDLPLSAATEVNAVRDDVQKRAEAIRSNDSLSSDERNSQLAALSNEASGKISKTLGANGLEAYRQYGGSWLNNIKPQTQSPVAK